MTREEFVNYKDMTDEQLKDRAIKILECLDAGVLMTIKDLDGKELFTDTIHNQRNVAVLLDMPGPLIEKLKRDGVDVDKLEQDLRQSMSSVQRN